LLTGANTIEEAKQLQSEIDKLMKSGGFHSRKWSSNSEEVLAGVEPTDRATKSSVQLDRNETVKTLGLWWNPDLDVFQYVVQIGQGEITKRSMLSEFSRIFDPLGLLVPVTIKAKLIIHELWAQKMDWNRPSSSKLQIRWREFRNNLQHVNKIQIPRRITADKEVTCTQLHIFCDASNLAYGSCICLRSTDVEDNIMTRLIATKSSCSIKADFTTKIRMMWGPVSDTTG
jgi:hypothetical protein